MCPPARRVQTPAVQAELKAVDAALAKAAPSVRVVSYASTGSPTLVGTGNASTIVLAYPPHDGDDMDTAAVDTLTKAAKTAAPDLTVHGTSLKALASGSTSTGGNSTVLGELLIGALGALIVLAWVFGSFLALLPLIMALVSVLTMQLFIYGLTYLVPSSSPLNPAVQYIVALLGLGLSIDYSLLVVTRWREERAAGKPNDEAVRAAMKRAGHSVWFSGLVASLGLFALIVVPNSVVRGIGLAGLVHSLDRDAGGVDVAAGGAVQGRTEDGLAPAQVGRTDQPVLDLVGRAGHPQPDRGRRRRPGHPGRSGRGGGDDQHLPAHQQRAGQQRHLHRRAACLDRRRVLQRRADHRPGLRAPRRRRGRDRHHSVDRCRACAVRSHRPTRPGGSRAARSSSRYRSTRSAAPKADRRSPTSATPSAVRPGRRRGRAGDR